MTEILTNAQRLQLLSHSIDLLKAKGGFTETTIAEIYSELNDLINPKPAEEENDNSVTPKEEHGDWEDVNKAFIHLFNVTRSFVELAEPVHNDECLVNTDNLNDLDAAYQEVNRLLTLPANKISERDILSHCIDIPRGVAPTDTIALTCGIEMQAHGFWYVVRAWNQDLSSHLVQYGYLTSWNDVARLVFETRFLVIGHGRDVTMKIWRAALDIGGEKSSAEDAYNFIKTNGRGVIFGIKGASKSPAKKVTPIMIDKMTVGGNRPSPEGITLYLLDMNQFKDQFYLRLNHRSLKNQNMTLHACTGPDYAWQILAEDKQKDDKGNGRWVVVRPRNHFLACESMAAAAADSDWKPSLLSLAGQGISA